MYFRCTDLLQGGFFFLNHSVKNKKKGFWFFLSLFGAWDGAGGADTSCLKLHEVFTKPSAHQIPLKSALSVSYFFPLTQNEKVHLAAQ